MAKKTIIPVYRGMDHREAIGELMIEDADDALLGKLSDFICPDCDGLLVPLPGGQFLYCRSCQRLHGLVDGGALHGLG